MGLNEQKEIMEIVTSWQQSGAQKALEKVAVNLLREGMTVEVITRFRGNRQLLTGNRETHL